MKKNSTRQKIINSAYKLFYEKGFNGTSIDDILRDSGLNKGSLYHLFKSKKEVLLAVIHEKIAYNLEQKYKDVATVEHPLTYLEEKLLTTESFDFKHGCALNNLVQEMSPVDADVAKALLEAYDNLEHYYFLALKSMDMDEEKKQTLSKMMVATVEGAIMAAKASQDKTPYLRIIQQMFTLLPKPHR
ncbi:TetR/AcrR family transcriptional regulator [Sulfurovum sp. NBC37-1]|uniref:TetR/AcrR family transcriptional regulator n=1 Tax=Sulfurovum sp. (strain NBC37-1) TaxID=387093 RepID=UPI0001587697|nr:TetR/AcrR family transcriptional regulator [Sulfurovum sp. NBC37-1]BAF71888.1 transcriptional regulator, TetR family [Sulfurovum sp. NBC37-1]